jgi:membrane protease YdiL (CAAX protease family)
VSATELAEPTYGPAQRIPAAGLSSARRALPLYAAVTVAAEAVIVYVDVTMGLVLDAVLLFSIMSHYVAGIHRLPSDRFGRSPEEQLLDVLPALALVPLLRILSLTVPVDGASEITWQAMVGVPLVIAAALTIRALRLPAGWVGLDLSLWRGQLQIALAGVPLSLSAYVILRPEEIAAIGSPGWVVGVPVVILFSGLALELVFRGLLQRALSEVLGRVGIALTCALFAATFLGTESAGYVAFMGLVGALFGWSFHRTGSIMGISLAHGLLNVGLLLIWPNVLG